MNWLTIVLAVAAAGIIVFSTWRGFLRIMFSTLFFGLALISTMLFTPKMNDLLSSSVYIRAFAEERADSYLDAQSQKAEASLEEKIDAMPLPESVGSLLKQGASSAMNAGMYATGDVRTAIREEIIDGVLRCAATLLTFVISLVVLLLAAHFLALLLDIPVLGAANRIAGMLLGVVQALLIIWVFLAITTLLAFTGPGAVLMEQVETSPVLSALAENNIVLEILAARAETLFLL